MSLIIRSLALLLVLLAAWPPGSPAPTTHAQAPRPAAPLASPPRGLN